MPITQPNGRQTPDDADSRATPIGSPASDPGVSIVDESGPGVATLRPAPGSTSDSGRPRTGAGDGTDTDEAAALDADATSDIAGRPNVIVLSDVDAQLNDRSVRDLAAQFEDEKPGRPLGGLVGIAVTVWSVAVAVLVLWQVFQPLAQGSQYYLVIFLTGILPLVFLVYPSGLGARAFRLPWGRDLRGQRLKPTPLDYALALVAIIVCAYPLIPLTIGEAGGGYNEFLNRQGSLVPFDVVMGAILLLLIIEAVRRTTGWVLPLVCLVFFLYDYYGGFLPQRWDIAHAGLDFDQIIDALYNSGSGFYGTPLDVAATYIVLFTIYGAVLDISGAAAFFVELSVAAFRRSRSAAGRTAVASGFLLGTVSGSGAATTVSIGSVTWPILKRAGYPPERAGGMLAASGVGAILSPPTLGAAAFLIAELLNVSYLKVLGWATIPTVLYYLGILLAVEIDARKFGARAVQVTTTSPWRLLGRFGYHFSSLFVIIFFLAVGQPATRAVVYATALAAILSFLDRRHMLTPRRAIQSLSVGVRGVLPVAAVCAVAGIITVSTTKTGLGPQMAALLVSAARVFGDNATLVLILSAILAAVALTLLGSAIPVTASFIIGWVIIGPALQDLGASAAVAAMFVFYFAVLSEATPPTALAAVAAAAITGGRVLPTMWQTLRYALPAFLVPMAFVLTPAGEGLLGIGGFERIAYAFVASAFGVVALAIAAGGWLPGVGPAGLPERLIAGVAGLTLLWLSPTVTVVGGVLLTVTVVGCLIRRRTTASLREERS